MGERTVGPRDRKKKEPDRIRMGRMLTSCAAGFRRGAGILNCFEVPQPALEGRLRT